MESNGILMGYITKQLLGNQTWLLGTELGCQGCWMLLDAGGVNKVDVAGKSTMASSGISKPRLIKCLALRTCQASFFLKNISNSNVY